MKKVLFLLICLCLFLAVSCSKGDDTTGDATTKYTLVTHDGTVFKNMTKVDYGYRSAVVHGYLPDGTKIWASGNWYVIRESQ